MKRALVTGSAGFVGAHYYRRLTRLGYHVTGVDLAHGVDVRDWVRSNHGAKFDLAIHCAAIVGGRATIDGSPFSIASNMAVDHAFVNWARIAKPAQTILFSSSAVYPVAYQQDHMRVRLQETDVNLNKIQSPDNSYGFAKLALEQMARWAGLENTLILRPFSGYSDAQSMDYPFRAILERVKLRMDPVTVWSDSVRDWVHIEDIVNGSLSLLQSGVIGPVNMCTGVPTSFTDLVCAMAEVLDPDYCPDVLVADGAPRGVAYRVGDPTLLNLYYTPRITLSMGIQKALTTIPV